MINCDDNNDNFLFKQIARGDENAYTRIFHLYTPKLFPYILKITKDEQLAKDLLQETFLRLWMKRADLETVRQPDSWLFRIAVNLCLTDLRKQFIRSKVQNKVFEKMQPAKYQPTETLEARDMELLIHKAVQTLPHKRKEVYLLSREQELSYQEIAAKLDISIYTVRNQLGTAMKSIQEYLHEHTGLSMTFLLLLIKY